LPGRIAAQSALRLPSQNHHKYDLKNQDQKQTATETTLAEKNPLNYTFNPTNLHKQITQSESASGSYLNWKILSPPFPI